MMLVQEKNLVVIPDICPKCGSKLNHVNALDTHAKIYMVWCRNSVCRFCIEYEKIGSEIVKCV